jgi:hypothetical protein
MKSVSSINSAIEETHPHCHSPAYHKLRQYVRYWQAWTKLNNRTTKIGRAPFRRKKID